MRWDVLDAGVFGPKAMVVGVAPSVDGVVALTLLSGEAYEEEDRTELASWTLTGPWQSWTSTDGRTWTAHAGPDFMVPRGMSGQINNHPSLLAGAGNDLIAMTLGGQPLAFSRDGTSWDAASLGAFPGGPAGWRGAAIVPFGPGFLSVGYNPTRSVALSSADGRTWAGTALPAGCEAGDLVVGRAGVIVTFATGDPHFEQAFWCSSLDGRSWRNLPDLPPLGYDTTRAAQECQDLCPNGRLLGNGERMLAYRGYPKQAGWTSFNGRSWRSLTFSGSRPTGWTESSGYEYTTLALPIGLLFYSADEGYWFGAPLT